MEGLQEIVVDTAHKTVSYYVANVITATDTFNTCGVTSTSDVPWVLTPFSPGCMGDQPVTFPLPKTFDKITRTEPWSGVDCDVQVPLSGTITFTLEPILEDVVDDPCRKKGGSSIACQSQSLAEDLPVVGTGFSLHYESDRTPGRESANAVAIADVQQIGGWTLNVHHAYDPGSNTLFLGNGRRRSAWQFGPPVTYKGNTFITSEDGSEVYVFSSTGQHLQTLKPLTGALKYQFGYDAAGYLTKITDASGNVTSIQRDSAEHPTDIVSPFSQTTNLTLDGHNFLSTLTDPAGHTATFTNTGGGLVASRTDAKGNIYDYSYDSAGRLMLDSDPAGGSISLSRINSGSGYSVSTTTALGRKSTYQIATGLAGEQFTNTWPNGLQATFSNIQQSGQLNGSTALPDGTTDSETLGPDPVWGLQLPVDISETLTQGNLTMNSTGSRVTKLGTSGNPFSVANEKNTQTINGRTYTSTFTGSNHTWVNTSPVGRSLTLGLDSLERIATAQIGGLTATDFAYDSHGRLASATQGTRKTTFVYDSSGFLSSFTDPLQRKTSFAYDADGRLLSTTLADGRIIGYAYDPNGNLTSVIPPEKLAHDFDYTAVDQMSEYFPPSAPGTGSTTYIYNADRDITKITALSENL